MNITATLDRSTLITLLNELTPLRVLIGGEENADRWFEINRPDRVEFVANEGLRLHTSAKVQWTVAGLHVPFTIRTLQILIRPVIAASDDGGKLVFHPHIENADLENVPDLIDKTIVAVVNDVLESQGDKLAWDIGKTITRSFGMPATLEPIESIKLGVDSASVQVLRESLSLSMELSMHFARRT